MPRSPRCHLVSVQVDVGNEVCRPLIAMLLPEVRNGSVQPAAASLLATLLKRFPQHAAAVPAMGAEGAAAGDETLAAASSAGELPTQSPFLLRTSMAYRTSGLYLKL